MTDENKFEIVPSPAQPVYDRNDPAFKIEESPDNIRSRVQRTCRSLDRHYLELGFDLNLVFERELWRKWNYDSFEAYVYNEVGRSDSWVKEMLNVWKKYRSELYLTDDKLKGIGYTKAAALLPVINEKNKNEWLEKAKSHNLRELRQAIKTTKEARKKKAVDADLAQAHEKKALERGDTDALNLSGAPVITKGDEPRLVEEDEFVRKIFMLVPEQLRWLETAFMAARKDFNSTKDGYLLCCIISEYLNHRELNADKGKENPLLWMRAFQQRFGGNLVWIKNEEQANLLRGVIEDNRDAFNTGGMTNE